MTKREEFLAGERPDDVALYLSDAALSGSDKLAEYGERVPGGVLLVLDGTRGRSVFTKATGMDAMPFAQRAMRQEGEVDHGLAGGTCPHAGETVEAADESAAETDTAAETDAETHEVRFVFAFAEAQNEAVGDIYAEGNVVHAYAHCSCGAAFSDRWVVEN